MEVSREWTALTLLGSAAAGGPPPGLERFARSSSTCGSIDGFSLDGGRHLSAKQPTSVGGGGSGISRDSVEAARHMPPPPPPPATAAVAAVLAPSLHAAVSRTLRLRTALLLHGPAGGGKRAAAAAAAAALGAAFVSISCHELVAEGGEKRLATAIGAAFEAAAAHAPAVLYMRRFGALAAAAGAAAGGSGGGGSGAGGEMAGGGGGATSSVAQALHRAISAHTATATFAATSLHDVDITASSTTQRGSGGGGGGGGGDGGRRGSTRGDDEDETEAERAIQLRRRGGGGGGGSANATRVATTATTANTGTGIGGGGSGGGGGGGVVVLVVGVEDLPSLPESIRQCFTHEVKVSPPSEPERLATLHACLGSGRSPEECGHGVEDTGKGNVGFTATDLAAAASATSVGHSEPIDACRLHPAWSFICSLSTEPNILTQTLIGCVMMGSSRVCSRNGL